MQIENESEHDRNDSYKRLRLKELDVRLSYLHPRHKLQDQQQRLIELEEELRTLMRDRVKETRHRLAIQIEKLNGLSPVRKLNQGFGLCGRSRRWCCKEYPSGGKG